MAFLHRRIMALQAYTLSIGIACQRVQGEELDGLLLRSDQALYRAKQLGRDRVEIAGDDSAVVELAPAMSLCR